MPQTRRSERASSVHTGRLPCARCASQATTNPHAGFAARGGCYLGHATQINHNARLRQRLIFSSLATTWVVRIEVAVADVIEEILAASNQIVTLRPGEVLFREHDEPDGMYILKRGRLGILIGSTPLETVRERGLVGEMAIVEGNRLRSATVIARTYCELVFIDTERFLSLVASNPRFSITVMEVMARRLRTMNSRFARTPKPS
jgi:CRP/FNR family transcriptional regulator, cyclic AMP receptor protein